MAGIQAGALVVFACGCALIVLALVVVAPLPRVRRLVGTAGLVVTAGGLVGFLVPLLLALAVGAVLH